MSDFLSHLADRALNLPPMVRPRLPSTYESPAAPRFQEPLEQHIEVPAEPRPVSGSAREERLQPRHAETESSQASEEVDREPALAREPRVSPQSPPKEPVVSRRIDSLPMPLPAESQPAGELTPAEPTVMRDEVAAKPDRQPDRQPGRQSSRQLDRLSETAAKQPVASPATTKATPPDRSPDDEVETSAPAPQTRPPQPRTLSPELQPHAKNPAMQPTVVTVQAAQRQRDEQQSKSHAKNTAAQPAVVAVSSAKEPREDQAEPPVALGPARREGPPGASAPSVHVTIGRVEIRAVMPPTPEPRPASPSPGPKLSLAEYLKRNAGVAR